MDFREIGLLVTLQTLEIKMMGLRDYIQDETGREKYDECMKLMFDIVMELDKKNTVPKLEC